MSKSSRKKLSKAYQESQKKQQSDETQETRRKRWIDLYQSQISDSKSKMIELQNIVKKKKYDVRIPEWNSRISSLSTKIDITQEKITAMKNRKDNIPRYVYQIVYLF